MNRYELILFDLDGTLTDSGPGIMNAAAYSLRKMGAEPGEREGLRRFVGPPLYDSYENYYGFTEAQAREAVAYFREYYTDTGIFENSVYPGTAEALSALRETGARLAVATSKPDVFARSVLEHFDLAKYFALVSGATMDGTLIKKADVIARALELSGSPDKSRAVMVGDREHDIDGARANGLDSVGVLYGYGSRDELERAGAVFLAASPGELPGLLSE